MTDSDKKKLFDRARREVLTKKTAIQRDAVAEIIRLLKLASQRIRETLASAPSDFQQWRLPQLQQQIQQRLAEFDRGATTNAAAAASQAWDAGTQLVDAPLRASGVASNAIGIDRRALDAMTLFLTDRIRGLTSAAMNKINTELGLVILGVQSPGEAIGKVAKILGDKSRQRAITIVRTEVGRAFSAAAQNRLEAAKASVPALKKMWRRSGKIHSRPEHDAIDGQVKEVDEPFEVINRDGEIIEILFPRDPKAPPGETINCGCESLPFMESWTSVKRGIPFNDNELIDSELRRNPVKAAFKARQKRAA